MKRASILAVFLVAIAGVAAPAVHAQVDTNSPIVVRQNTPKAVWIKGNVVHADGKSIVISELNNPRALHTFTYSGKSLAVMTKVLNEGGYQVGDKVKVQYVPGSTVALDIHGRPSKPH